MDRLWVRLALAFAALVLVVTALVNVINFVVYPVDALLRELMNSSDALALQQAFMRRRPVAILYQSLIVFFFASLVGLWLSRSMTAPLNRLAEAARAIGRQDLSQRVAPQGSRELVEVIGAFNVMAADLEQAEGLRRQLMADIAHELRTPLTVLQGNLQALIDDVYPMEKEEMVRLHDQTRHLSRLVEDLHVLAQAEAHRLPLTRAETAPVPLVKEAVNRFQPLAAQQRVALRLELLGRLSPVTLDSHRITQALDNLIANALRHTPAGGEVIVSVGATPDALTLSVRDTGSGIAAEHLPFVFDRFYRTDPARSRDAGGSGLGLAIARAIAEAHGGSLSAASAGSGQGSTFTLQLPQGNG